MSQLNFVKHDAHLVKPRAPAAKPRPQLRTCAEMAQEFGVSIKVLSGIIRWATDAPRPALTHAGRASTSQKSYYPMLEMRAWWAKRCERVKR